MVFWGGITNDTENLTRGKEKTRQNDDVNQNHNDGGDDECSKEQQKISGEYFGNNDAGSRI